MNLEQLQNTVIDALEDVKGQNIQVFNAQPMTSMFDRVVIVSGTSNRQTRALAKNLHDKVKQAGTTAQEPALLILQFRFIRGPLRTAY